MGNIAASPAEYLDNLQFFGMKLGLGQTFALLERCGNPHKGLRFIHAAGTNGKGSVCAMLNAALVKAGFKTGLYTSPHLTCPGERIRVSGKAISQNAMDDALRALIPACEDIRKAGGSPTYFEVMTVLAALHFAREKTDFVVWETGMGGRLDATNAVSPVCSVITGISLEHQQWLGDTIAKIAAEKAGIIKKGAPVFLARVSPEADAVFVKIAESLGSPVFRAPELSGVSGLRETAGGREFEIENIRVTLPLRGAAQLRNFSLAFEVLKYLSEKFSFSLSAAASGIADTRWPARFQILPDGTIIDGAHNAEGALALSEFLNESFPGEKFNIVFASLPDKDSALILSALLKHARKFVFVQVDGRGKSLPPEKLDDKLKTLDPSGEIEVFRARDVDEALKAASGSPGRTLIAGSLYLAGECLKRLRPLSETLDIL